MISLSKRKEGFTIVELLIVIVVIGILAGLVITTYNGIQQKARNTERQTDLKALQGQLEAYYATNGYYPTATNLGAGGTDGTDNVTFIQANMKGLDKEALRDPNAAAGDYSMNNSAATANQYAYIPSPDSCDDGSTPCTGYELQAVKEGTASTDSDHVMKLDSLN